MRYLLAIALQKSALAQESPNMPTGLTFETASLDRFVVIAQSSQYLGNPFCTQVNQGYTRYADNSNLDTVIAAQTPYIQAYMSVWLKSYSSEDLMLHPFSANGELLVYVPKDTSIDMNQLHDAVIGLTNDLTNPVNYSTGESSGSLTHCRLIKSVLHDIRVIDGQGIAIFDLGAYGAGEILFGPIS